VAAADSEDSAGYQAATDSFQEKLLSYMYIHVGQHFRQDEFTGRVNELGGRAEEETPGEADS
jgi:hypothetical protein